MHCKSFFFFIIINISGLFAQVPHEYLVKFSEKKIAELKKIPGASADSLIKSVFPHEKIQQHQILIQSKSHPMYGWIIVKTNDPDPSWLNKSVQNNEIEYFSRNNIIKLDNTPNDSLFSRQWYHTEINAALSWKNFSFQKQALLAIIDTGIDYNHPDLAGSLWINSAEDLNQNGKLDSADLNYIDDDGNGYVDDVIGWDFTDAPRFPDGGDYELPDNDPMDEFQKGHGTQIAGIIAAQTNNITGIAGLAPGVSVMNLRAGTAAGYLEEDDVGKAILYAVENNADVINMSFGDVVVSRFLKDAVEYAYRQGVVLVASSGNSGTNELHYPSGFPWTISIGATAQGGALAGFSSWGSTLDLCAPGSQILAPQIGGTYGEVNGTSFSAPMVAATAALLRSDSPNLKNEQIRNILKSTARDRGPVGWDPYYGSGILDMEKVSQVQQASELMIHFPLSGDHTSNQLIPILATIQDPDLYSFSFEYGIGENAASWCTLLSDQQYQVIRDTLYMFDLSNIPDTTISLRLKVRTLGNNINEYRSFFVIDRTPADLVAIKKLKMIEANRYAVLVEFQTDDICNADLFLREQGSSANYMVKNLRYETRQHRVLLTADEINGDIEFYIRLRNSGGLVSEFGKETPFKMSISPEVIPRLPENSTGQYLPSGFMMPTVSDLDKDGNAEICISRYDENRSFGPIEIYEFENGTFQKRLETGFPGIPRDAGDADNDGLQELLVGYGKNSLLIESQAANEFPSVITWVDSTDFWSAKITDLDNDQKNELIGRAFEKYVVLENTADNQFNPVYSFENPTDGENFYGPPKIINTDITGNGFTNVVFGDYDGDVMIFENSGDNDFNFLHSEQLSLPDATDYLVAGNFLNSGKRSLLAGSHSSDNINYEHEFDARYWRFAHLVSDGSGQFQNIQTLNIYGYFSTRDYDSGFSSAPRSAGQTDWVFLAAFPDLYVFESLGDSLVPVYYLPNMHTNTVLYHDFDNDGFKEIYLNTGDRITGFETGQANRTGAPVLFTVYPQDTSQIHLDWSAIQNAQSYKLYRSADKKNWQLQDSILITNYIDSLLSNNQKYYYRVTAIDSLFEIPESNFSNIDSARTNYPPRVDSVLVLNDRQIKIGFNEKMNPASLAEEQFVLNRQNLFATSSLPANNGKAVVVNFPEKFRAGIPDTILIGNIRDLDKTALNISSRAHAFLYSGEKSTVYLKSANIVGKNRILIEFNSKMDTSVVLEINNYLIDPCGDIAEVRTMNEDLKQFELIISGDNYLGASGINNYLVLQNLRSADGILAESYIKVPLIAETGNLNSIFVYPQPVTAGRDHITFANVALNTEISIFDLNGRFLIKLQETDLNGGISWDLRSENGDKISSGVYIYRAENNGKTKMGKLTVIR